jgi:hypothetical protein
VVDRVTVARPWPEKRSGYQHMHRGPLLCPSATRETHSRSSVFQHRFEGPRRRSANPLPSTRMNTSAPLPTRVRRHAPHTTKIRHFVNAFPADNRTPLLCWPDDAFQPSTFIGRSIANGL